MANLLAGEGLFPELIQDAATAENLAAAAVEMIRRPEKLAQMRAGLRRMLERLGGPGASRRAAEEAMKLWRSREGLKKIRGERRM
jgi:lipid-A-disaccharide synthase